MILGVGTGVVAGGIVGSQTGGDRSESTIKGAVLGGVALGLTSYLIHNALESRDAKVRRETLLNLEHYEVLGFDNVNSDAGKGRNEKCFTTKDVDGRLVSIPCYLVNDSPESEENKR